MERGINTRCLHLEGTEGKTDNYGALSYPIYQTATYAHAGVGKSTGYDYSRLQNPTREQLEKVVAFLICSGDFFAASCTMNGKLRNPYETCTISLESSIKKNRML